MQSDFRRMLDRLNVVRQAAREEVELFHCDVKGAQFTLGALTFWRVGGLGDQQSRFMCF